MTFLDDQLERVYLTENLEKSISQFKSKGPAIVKGMDMGNLFQVRRLLNTFPDSSLEELMQAAYKARNFNRYHLEAKRIVKGDQTEMQKVFILTYASLKGIQAGTKDKTALQKIDEAIATIHELAKKYSSRMMSEGFTLALLMMLIGYFFNHIPIIGKLIVLGGQAGIVLFFFGLLLMVVRIILNTYFSLKGIK